MRDAWGPTETKNLFNILIYKLVTNTPTYIATSTVQKWTIQTWFVLFNRQFPFVIARYNLYILITQDRNLSQAARERVYSVYGTYTYFTRRWPGESVLHFPLHGVRSGLVAGRREELSLRRVARGAPAVELDTWVGRNTGRRRAPARRRAARPDRALHPRRARLTHAQLRQHLHKCTNWLVY